ncbi:MAG: hypothetical protein R2710_04185 [Acidimicrobiales bacterium]
MEGLHQLFERRNGLGRQLGTFTESEGDLDLADAGRLDHPARPCFLRPCCF